MPYCVMFKFAANPSDPKEADGPGRTTIYMACEDNGTILAYAGRQAALDAFQKPYKNFHRRGFEASMSACYHFIFFQPRVVAVRDAEELKQDVVALPAPVCRCRTIAGTMVGRPCEGPGAERLYESGEAPRLVPDDPPPAAELSEPEEEPDGQMDLGF